MRTEWVMPVVGSIAQRIVVVTPGGVPDRSTFELAPASAVGGGAGQLL